MCGISGVVSRNPSAVDLDQLIRKMTVSLEHRGPDGDGFWLDPVLGVALGHRRLSIVGVGPLGTQPMVSDSGRFVLTFNGEIYNFRALADELRGDGYSFRTGTDTEIVLTAFEAWGIRDSLNKFAGMFALGVLDRLERKLVLARDRMGEKPLYYGWVDNEFIFGSELRAFRKHRSWKENVNKNALTEFMVKRFVPDGMSIYEDIYKLPRASWITLELDSDKRILDTSTWADENPQSLMSFSDPSFSEFEELLTSVVEEHLVADVEVGVLLSSGIDSSLVAALASQKGVGKIKSFTVGFDDPLYDESDAASRIAKELGLEHHKVFANNSDISEVVTGLANIYDEPFADSSQIPMTLISRFARDHVKSVLSGDGGDELFGGYNRYLWAGSVSKILKWMPDSIKSRVSDFSGTKQINLINNLNHYLAKCLPKRLQISRLGEKFQKFSALANLRNEADIYFHLTNSIAALELLSKDFQTPLEYPPLARLNDDDFMRYMMNEDQKMYLPGDILVKTDRASMHFGLEVRAPFLDKRIVHFSEHLPISKKIMSGQGKLPLRKVLARHLPRDLIDRPKSGFSIPIGNMLRGPLSNWAESLLGVDALEQQGIFNAAKVKAKWERHKLGQEENEHLLWQIVVFQQWYQKHAA